MDKKSLKTTDKQPLKVADKEPVKTTDKQPLKAVGKQSIKTTDKQPLKAVDRQPLKTADKQSLKTTALGGIVQNPTFVLVLGMCPLIATSTSFINALLMGLCTAFVLVCSNVVVSALRKVIPDQVRLPAYIMIIATFVTVVQLFLDKFMPVFYESVSTFIALIVVNCIILGRAEAFAGKNDVLHSAVDGLSMGLGFVGAIALLGGVRQLLGDVLGITVFLKPAGGFIVLALLMALFSAVVYYVKRFRLSKERGNLASEEAL